MKILTFGILLALVSVGAFALGGQESQEITGTVSEIASTDAGTVEVTIVTEDGESYSMVIPEEEFAALEIETGTVLEVEGDVDDDGEEIEIEWIGADGREWEVEFEDDDEDADDDDDDYDDDYDDDDDDDYDDDDDDDYEDDDDEDDDD